MKRCISGMFSYHHTHALVIQSIGVVAYCYMVVTLSAEGACRLFLLGEGQKNTEKGYLLSFGI